MQPNSDCAQAPISISLNFDSLNEAYGFPQGYRDPSYFAAFDRFVALANKHGLKFTIYIIAKDLDLPEHFARVREWAAAGFDIGNHTMHHYHDLGARPVDQVTHEIVSAHHRIAECTGQEPRGFIAPAWANSERVIRVLTDLGYAYDTSIFPSVILYPMLTTAALSHASIPRRAYRIMHRRDWMAPLSKPLHPFFIDRNFKVSTRGADRSLLVLPLPALSRFAPPVWHTAGFALGWKKVFRTLEGLLQRHPGFYYLIHPGDFLAPDEQHATMKHGLVRMNIPLKEKMAFLDEAFGMMAASGRPKGTMADIARYHGANFGKADSLDFAKRHTV